MKIYTGYFANMGAYKDLFPIAICKSVPAGIKVGKLQQLSPSWDLLKRYKNHEVTPAQYTEEFNAQLSKLNPDNIRQLLAKISNGQDIVLLCWERSGYFCHRHLVAAWLGGVTEA